MAPTYYLDGPVTMRERAEVIHPQRAAVLALEAAVGLLEVLTRALERGEVALLSQAALAAAAAPMALVALAALAALAAAPTAMATVHLPGLATVAAQRQREVVPAQRSVLGDRVAQEATVATVARVAPRP